jgi:IclR family acetate operon transcriptional repressor
VLSLLRAVANSDDPPRISDLTRVTGYDRAAVQRLMQPLIQHGFVAREPRDKRYVLGPGMLALWAGAVGKFDLRGLARPVMEAIAERTSETVSLHIRDGLDRVCIDSVEGVHPVRRVVPIGERLPLTAGPTGKTMLAFLPRETIDAAVLASPRGAAERRALWRDLDEAVARGFLIRVGDRIEAVGGLSVPVFDTRGIAAVVTTSGPGQRFSAVVMTALAPFVVEQCEQLSRLLGHVDSERIRSGDGGTRSD